MLRYQTHLTKMHLLLAVWSLMVVVAAAVPPCDPLTQYEQAGECCKKCGPGTRMSSLSTCQDPQCQDCRENEYQDSYTTEHSCNLQPYCDPNKNFEVPVNKNTKKMSPCLCKQGYHCSERECIFCTEHTKCQPGFEVESKGDHLHDTVCRVCPAAMFSNSADGICKKWTECEAGYHIKTNGTSTSDNICEQDSRSHVGLIFGVLSCVILAGLGFLIFKYKCRGNPRDNKKMINGGLEPFVEKQIKPDRGDETIIANPTCDEHSLISEVPPSQEEAMKTPEENDDDLITGSPRLTENGNFVVQEGGKEEVLSRQESQVESLLTFD
ncbi:hypothetical protein LDENG_00189510 [Lucifuga dentata]|nr:hypothetical protein LDENG_00189510 [Lucifuga dentata]